MIFASTFSVFCQAGTQRLSVENVQLREKLQDQEEAFDEEKRQLEDQIRVAHHILQQAMRGNNANSCGIGCCLLCPPCGALSGRGRHFCGHPARCHEAEGYQDKTLTSTVLSIEFSGFRSVAVVPSEGLASLQAKPSDLRKRALQNWARCTLDQLHGFALHLGLFCVTEEYVRLGRCHKMWLFKQPIRRYDHYCRWLTNAVGLLNHREFVTMLAGLLMIGLCGCIIDFILIIWTSSEGRHFTGFLLIMHLTYSVILSLLTGPILRLHITFVTRNELANEYKHNLFHVLRDVQRG
eukprot:g19790.t1